MDELAIDLPGPPPPPPPLHLPLPPDDLLLEILLRFPPEPIYLFRASLVSKHWRVLVHDVGFLRRFREFHGGTPPILGFFNFPGPPFFVPTGGTFAVSKAAKMSHDDWWALDCRHGHALLESRPAGELLVWDLVTGDQRYLPRLEQAYQKGLEYNAAVLCAADHNDYHSCPFLVALVFSSRVDFITSACVYSSETGVWGDITSIHVPNSLVGANPTALVGNTLYWLLGNNGIIGFDLDKYRFDLIEEVPYSYKQAIIIMPTEDGVLGCAGVDGFKLHLWSREARIHGVESWTRCRIIDLEKSLAPGVPAPAGYAENANVIFIDVYSSVYMIHLKSMKIEEVTEQRNCIYIFPYTSFYSPV
ncbi:hypothetical protein CFC21_054284 [Triticum aestivum]|uniref:F-box domain-containing protein n=2 Tax=Triticum aestivum TaxID=4565 RepID=A0A9R1GDN3_WHEAT|nr:hypothetical protein CFC21_054284 [Triticum aestivum]